MLKVDDSALVVVGVKVTLIVQFEFAPSVLPHLLAAAKSLAFVPVIEIELIVSVVVLLFVSVTVCAGLVALTLTFPKLIEGGVAVTDPGGAVPVPLSVSV
jgi:hypothetical protein